MFKNAVRAVRPAALAARSSLQVKSVRVFSTSMRAASGGPPAPQLFGAGGKAGQVPTDFEQATGLERLELLGEMEGIKVFDDAPLDASRLGTKANPVLVQSYDVERIVGCTGVPADSHDILWFNVKKDHHARCTECGSVYALDFQGEEHHDDHAHH
ncbi:cytochrome c oxidase polypeptide IV [Pluteus cervinus]|uniref:Cytochrome c oxidase polypeptide IV n=1 Tax=Pluteus cervinus TaxID=181527 RepID=A0ACD3BBK0_9AGAR|nr:cytochrome c oxidase polypeptide IV [Pluteus cervinus]